MLNSAIGEYLSSRAHAAILKGLFLTPHSDKILVLGPSLCIDMMSFRVSMNEYAL